MSELIYLDNAATTWPKPEQVHQFMRDFYTEFGVNPGRSGYDKALEAEAVLHQCRTRLTKLFNGDDPNRLVFAYNATDALNQVIQGVTKQGGHVISSNLEHNSVLRPLWHLMDQGIIEVTHLPFNSQGFIEPDDVRKAIRPNTCLVILNHGSNVIGTIQPIEEIGQICREHKMFFAVDASQTAGVIPIDMKKMCIDAVCFTGHKSLFGPTGIGGICVAKDTEIRCTRWGGTGVKSALQRHLDEYPYHLEAGTVNTMGVAGLLAGQDFIDSQGGVEGIHKKEMFLMKRLWDGIRNVDGVILYCAESLDNHLPVLSMNVRGLEASDTGIMLDVEYDIATRTGLHCAPQVHKQLGTDLIKGTVRFAIGPFNTVDHIDAAIHAVKEIVDFAAHRKAR
ncbi:MAG: aminotransferase class V-fold PLP-dependent enzyme [Candidatus Electryoneaceae bacterium]|nr:aminotransferase class V-fold PLP-dependent enzyme [Candidatus Electryoneaceae bacterium]